MRRLYDDNKWNEGTIEELKKEVEKWQGLALAAGKRLQELTEVMKMYKEQEEAWEEMEEVLRRKIGLLKGRTDDDEAEELAKEVEKNLSLKDEKAKHEDGGGMGSGERFGSCSVPHDETSRGQEEGEAGA